MRGQPVAKEWADRKMPPGFLAVNGNKRSITLDLRRPEAVEIVKRLVLTTDVVWENFRPGVMDRLGMGYEAFASLTRDSSTARSPDSVRRGRSAPRPPSTGSSRPCPESCRSPASPPGDRCARDSPAATPSGGLTAALAVSSALYQRTHTGRGQFVDVAMLDAALAFIPGLGLRVHRGRYRAEADRQRLGEPQAHGPSLPGPGRLPRARRADREAVREPHAGDRAPRRAHGPALQGSGGADGARGASSRGDRGRARQRRPQDLGGAADRGRRALRVDLEDRRDRRAPAARAPRRAADDRLRLRPHCAWSAPASGSPTGARASTAPRPPSGNTPTTSWPKPATPPRRSRSCGTTPLCRSIRVQSREPGRRGHTR
jgi:CoA-transferase family III